jgi:hypothetical protein
MQGQGHADHRQHQQYEFDGHGHSLNPPERLFAAQ